MKRILGASGAAIVAVLIWGGGTSGASLHAFCKDAQVINALSGTSTVAALKHDEAVVRDASSDAPTKPLKTDLNRLANFIDAHLHGKKAPSVSSVQNGDNRIQSYIDLKCNAPSSSTPSDAPEIGSGAVPPQAPGTGTAQPAPVNGSVSG